MSNEYSYKEFVQDLLELVTAGRVVPAWYRGVLRYYSPDAPLPRGARRASVQDVLDDLLRFRAAVFGREDD